MVYKSRSDVLFSSMVVKLDIMMKSLTKQRVCHNFLTTRSSFWSRINHMMVIKIKITSIILLD